MTFCNVFAQIVCSAAVTEVVQKIQHSILFLLYAKGCNEPHQVTCW